MLIPEVKVPVRTLVEWVLRSGDLYAMGSSSSMQEGARIHREIQKGRENCRAEVPVSISVYEKGINLLISGRIDAVITDENGIIIEEIKSTGISFEQISPEMKKIHQAQASCYAWMYAQENDLSQIRIRVTYVHRDTGKQMNEETCFLKQQLADYFQKIVSEYASWAAEIHAKKLIRDSSAVTGFPYDDYRDGQRQMAVSVYRAVMEKTRLFIQAPTGIGKTMASIFPAVRTFPEGVTERIFFLTCRNTGKQSAEKSICLLREKGMKISSLTITAKEQICFMKPKNCDPLFCEYSKGFYDRINDALREALDISYLDRKAVCAIAEKHRICPFEFSLEAALFCDVIICDYNYLFDPRVFLKRFFLEKSDSVFLIDEAHNLVDRSREMYSCSLKKSDFSALKKAVGKKHILSRALENVNSAFLKVKKNLNEVSQTPPKELQKPLTSFRNKTEKWLETGEKSVLKEEIQSLYFEVLFYLKISENLDSHAVICGADRKDVRVMIRCLDASIFLAQSLSVGRTGIFFSATLSPAAFYQSVLGGDKSDKFMNIPSPFPADNLQLLIDRRYDLRFSQRDNHVSDIAHLIHDAVTASGGNSLVFFSSFEFMRKVIGVFTEKFSQHKTMVQTPGMTEQERNEFLEMFVDKPETSLTGFAVLGGIFSESIDLAGDRLSAVIIIGTGLPKVCLEQELIRSYFQKKNGKGFSYAYLYPGINRVLQAAGRVIRSEQDRGTVILVDRRYTEKQCRELLPYWWKIRVIEEEPGIFIRNWKTTR